MTTGNAHNTAAHVHHPQGIVLIDKPAQRAVSSVAACRAVKRRLIAGGAWPAGGGAGRMKIGHAGTLDPLASGLLIVLVGRAATRMCDVLQAGEKTYLASIDLTHRSPTDDYEAELVANPIKLAPPREAVEATLAGFRGRIMQRPPAFSAVRVNGQRSFNLARRGREVELAERPVDVHELAVLEYAYPSLVVKVRCGRGFYVRSLARDLGAAVTGFAGCLSALRRTAIGAYRVEDAWTLDSMPEQMTQADLISAPSLEGPRPRADDSYRGPSKPGAA